MSTALENPWLRLPAQPPYVVPEDAEAVDAFNSNAKDELALHLELLPEPFLGNPNAPVVLLNLNPGYSTDDLRHHQEPMFANLSRGNLVHNPARYPFYLLNPDLDALGCKWWQQKLKGPIELCGLDAVAQSVLCVEYFPYHSIKFGHVRLAVPSQQYGLQLVREAVTRNALIITMRSDKLWLKAVPELKDYSRLFRTRNPQMPAISPRNCPECFDLVVQLIQADTK